MKVAHCEPIVCVLKHTLFSLKSQKPRPLKRSPVSLCDTDERETRAVAAGADCEVPRHPVRPIELLRVGRGGIIEREFEKKRGFSESACFEFGGHFLV